MFVQHPGFLKYQLENEAFAMEMEAKHHKMVQPRKRSNYALIYCEVTTAV